MDRIVIWIKNILALFLIFLNIKYFKEYGLITFGLIVYLVFFIILMITFFNDNVKSESIKQDKKYNYLFILVEIVLILLFTRTLYDTSFLYNSEYYNDLIKSKITYEYEIQAHEIRYINFSYLYQNIYFIIAMITLLLVYHKINNPKIQSKYNLISVICLAISICFLLIVLDCISFVGFDIWLYLILNIILVGIEIYKLIKDNHKKREWIIYLSLVFNIIIFVFIVINFLV